MVKQWQSRGVLVAQPLPHTHPASDVTGLTAFQAATNDALAVRGYQAAGIGPPRNIKMPSWYSAPATSHNAFPSVVRRADGVLVMTWRGATNHQASRDGKAYLATSTDLGRTWSAPSLIVAGDASLPDVRDPCVSKSNDGQRLYLTYFKASASVPAGGVYFKYSTNGGTSWSPEVRADGGLPYAAVCAPAVQLASGRILVPFYGRSGSETIDSVWLAYSDNDGTTWSTTRILNGVPLAAHLQEPWLVRKPGADNLVMLYRHGGASNIGGSYTENLAGTGIAGWSGPTVLCQGTGRPSAVWLSTGEIQFHYRNLGNVRYMARTLDTPEFATGLTPPYIIRNCQGAGQGATGLWTYSQPIELGGGVQVCVFSEENAAATVSRVYTTWIARGGGPTPGGPVPNNWDAIATGYDRIEYALDMQGERRGLNPLVPSDLTVMAGAFTAVEMPGNVDIRVLTSAASDGSPDRAYLDTGVDDVVIEGEFYGEAQSGFALLGRIVDANNYLMFTLETNFGQLRLYKVVGAVATQLAQFSSSRPANAWHSMRMECRGSLITCFSDGWPVIAYGLAAGAEQTTFTSPTKHGFSLNSPSGGVHALRRFTVMSAGV